MNAQESGFVYFHHGFLSTVKQKVINNQKRPVNKRSDFWVGQKGLEPYHTFDLVGKPLDPFEGSPLSFELINMPPETLGDHWHKAMDSFDVLLVQNGCLWKEKVDEPRVG